MSAEVFFGSLTAKQCQGVVDSFGTPVWLYDRATIEARIADVKCFDVVRFAQKANSNLGILALMRRHGVVVDAVSAGEIERALRVGYKAQGPVPGIVFTADIIDRDALELVKRHNIPVNVGSPSMIRQLAEAGIQTELTLRVNPGFGHGHSRKTNTGGDLSKHGIWHEQVGETLALAKECGMPVTGLHMHIGSGSDFEHLTQVCEAMVANAAPYGAQLHTISAGGGLPIPYHKENPQPIDMQAYYGLWDAARRKVEAQVGHKVSLEVEPGRYLVAESGLLLTRIQAVKHMGSNLFYLVDAGFSDLVRPAFYGSWHHISILANDRRPLETMVDAIVGGPLCESGDVFTQEEGGYVVSRRLPLAKEGDLLVLHDTGAYGAAMSSNYNSRLYAPEVMWQAGQAVSIRKKQTFDHLLANDIAPDFGTEA